MRKMGGLQSILSMMPGMGGNLKGVDLDQTEDSMKYVEAIICSMTKKERSNPDIINPQRKIRIAKGAGVDIAEVNRVIKQHGEMKKMMKQMSGMMSGKGKRGFGGMKLPFKF